MDACCWWVRYRCAMPTLLGLLTLERGNDQICWGSCLTPTYVLFCFLLFKIVVHEPLWEIHQTVESPKSVYWQNDVWPGFDTYGRNWMVEQYLVGGILTDIVSGQIGNNHFVHNQAGFQ